MRRLYVLLALLAAAMPALAQAPADPQALIVRRDSITAAIERLQAEADSLADLIPPIDEQLRWVPPPTGLRYERVRTLSSSNITIYEAADEGAGTTFQGSADELIVTGYVPDGTDRYSRPLFYRVWHNGREGYISRSTYISGLPYTLSDASSRFDAVRGLRSIVPEGAALYVGPRGGCYYISEGGAKVYVDRGRCGDRIKASPGSTYAPSYGGSSGSTGGSVRVRGYTRRDGTYVRPHTRSRPRRN